MSVSVSVSVSNTLSLFNQSKNHLPPYLVADEKPYILYYTHHLFWMTGLPASMGTAPWPSTESTEYCPLAIY